ncbi:MAG: penicillin acylase family protein [Candidatus Kapabacteria bacterium]|nr:penicillin acylase family protein [Candidatus Kapabacteria bacterium]
MALNYKSKKTTVIITSGIILIASLIIFLVKFLNSSQSNLKGEFTSDKISNEFSIYRNFYGVPHIVAQNDKDMYFASGYVQAQDRLFQMDYYRRIGYGRLSEILGSKALNTDKFFRCLAIRELAKDSYKLAPEETKIVLQSYCDGINNFIENTNEYSFEFGALNYLPEKWTPVDCYVISKLYAFEMSFSYWSDMALGAIADRIGIQKTQELIPSSQTKGPFVLEDITAEINNSDSKNQSNIIFENKTIKFSSYLSLLNEIKEVTGFNVSAVGSNSWVRKKSNKINSGAILANDPHLQIGLPSKWYQIHLSSPSSNLTGFSVPGIPFVLIGRNDSIAWGITNLMNDDFDLFFEKMEGNDFYFSSKTNIKEKIKYTIDSIKVANGKTHLFYLRKTDRSYIISDNDKLLDSNTKSKDFMKKYVLTFNWTANEKSDEITSMLKISKSNNWNDFQNSLNNWISPALNFTYCDTKCNIGLKVTGAFPKRDSCMPNLPNPGWLSGYNWKGFHYANELPVIYNPIKGFVATANNKIMKTIPFFISNLWEPNSRALRVNELLSEVSEYNYRDAELNQLDIYSHYANDLLKLTLPVLNKNNSYFTNEIKKNLILLNKWDYFVTNQSLAANIYSEFVEKLIVNTFEDELGQYLLNEYVIIGNLPSRKLLELLENNDKYWFDIKSTNFVENRDFIILKSFSDAVISLKIKSQKAKTKNYNYGMNHILNLKHVLSDNNFLRKSVGIDGLELSGDNTTINNTEAKMNKRNEVIVGASMRFIADMQDSVIYSVLPGGVSGDVVSSNYSNQIQLWLRGGYIKIPTSRSPAKDFELFVKFSKK